MQEACILHLNVKIINILKVFINELYKANTLCKTEYFGEICKKYEITYKHCHEMMVMPGIIIGSLNICNGNNVL